MFEDEADSYPAQLDRLIDAYDVMNLGVPGFSTRHTLRRMRDAFDEGTPRAVLFTAGVNNLWSWREDPVGGGARDWVERLTLVKFVRLLLAGTVDVGAERLASGRWGQELVEARRAVLMENEVRATVLEDLEDLAALAAAAGTPLLAVGYGANKGAYELANESLRRAAERVGVPFVECSEHADELVAELGRSAVFHHDLHPRAVGYELVARCVFNALIELRIVEAVGPIDLLSGLSSGRRIELSLTASEAAPGKGPAVVISGGNPGAEFRLLLWGLRPLGRPAATDDFSDLWRSDPLFRATLSRDDSIARLDEDGRARVAVARLAESNALAGRNWALRACIVVRREEGVGLLSRPTDLVLRGDPGTQRD